MNKLIESIINKDYLTADKEFNKEISEKANAAIDNLKQEISESLLESYEKLEESKKLPMEEMKDENGNGVCDDEEQLDEISKDTLKSYVKGAVEDHGRHAMKIQKARMNNSKIGQLTNTNDYSDGEKEALKKAQGDMYKANSEYELKHIRAANKRSKGIAKAVDKLTKE